MGYIEVQETSVVPSLIILTLILNSDSGRGSNPGEPGSSVGSKALLVVVKSIEVYLAWIFYTNGKNLVMDHTAPRF